jgi:hypothetical protein
MLAAPLFQHEMKPRQVHLVQIADQRKAGGMRQILDAPPDKCVRA